MSVPLQILMTGGSNTATVQGKVSFSVTEDGVYTGQLQKGVVTTGNVFTPVGAPIDVSVQLNSGGNMSNAINPVLAQLLSFL